MKRYIAFFMLFIILLSGVIVGVYEVYGNAEYGNKTWTPDCVDCVGSDGKNYVKDKDYWILFYNQQGGGWFWHAEGGENVKKLRIADGKGVLQTVYCVGTGLPYVDNGEKYAREDPNVVNEYFGRLPDTAQQGIYLALLFGYEDGLSSPVPGTNGDDFWMATQVLVWEYHQGIREGVDSRKANGQIGADVYYNIIRNRPAERCYDWLLSQIRAYLAFPSFVQETSGDRKSSYVLTQYEKDGTYVLELYDDHQTGAQLEVIDETGAILDWLTVTYLGEYRYRIESTRPMHGDFILTVQKQLAQGYRKLLFYSDGTNDSQVVACRSTLTSSPTEVGYIQIATEDYVEMGSLTITKYTQGGDVSGFTFLVNGISETNNSFSQNISTDESGKAMLRDIPVGTYEISEILPEESPWQTPGVQQVVVSDRFTSNVVFNNTLKTGRILITKTFEGRTTPWEGIPFEVVGEYQGIQVFEQRVYTNSAGEIILTDIPIGTYTITELAGTHCALYILGESQIIQVCAGETSRVEVHNAAKRGTVEIKKKGAVIQSVQAVDGIYIPVLETYPLSGAVFEVYANEPILGDDGTVRIPKDTLVDRVVEDQGQYLSQPLYPGVYRVEEVVAPEGYRMFEKNETISVTVEADRIVSIEIENSLINSQVSFSKLLEGGNQELYKQVSFGLYAQDPIFALDGSCVPKDGLICIAQAETNGTVFMETPFSGNFYVREMETAPGYTVDDKIYPVLNGTIHEGQPILNVQIPTNPKTGEETPCYTLFGLIIITSCVVCRVAFYTKSRYNE